MIYELASNAINFKNIDRLFVCYRVEFSRIEEFGMEKDYRFKKKKARENELMKRGEKR